MAATFIKLFDPTMLTTSVATLGTVASTYASTALLENGKVKLVNVTAGAVTVDLHCVPSGGSATDTNAVLKGYSLAANSYLDVQLPKLGPGGTVQGKAGAGSSITAHWSGGYVQS